MTRNAATFGDEYRHGAKTGNRAPLQSAAVLRGFAKLPDIVPAWSALSDPDIAAALRYCRTLADFRNTPEQVAKREKKSRATGAKRGRPHVLKNTPRHHHDMIED